MASIVRWWHELSGRGNSTSFPIEKQKRIIMLNRFCFVMMVFPALIGLMQHFLFHATIISIYFFIIATLSCLTLFLNRYKIGDYAAIVFFNILPTGLLFLSCYAKSEGITNNMIFYILPRLGIFLFSLLPMFIFGYQDLRKWLYASIGPIFSMVFFDQMHQLFGVHYQNLPYIPYYYPMIVVITILMIVVVLIGIFSLQQVNMAYEKQLEAKQLELSQEKDKSDFLLLNILPEEVATELKRTGKATPALYEHVTVLFADIKEFTKLAAMLSPEEIIGTLDDCFLAFDEICEQHNMERIKTIGDAYMAAGGIPVENTTNAADAVATALAMQEFIVSFNEMQQAKGLPALKMRIGIHTGRVVAGVVGKKKFAYDIWGDAVNVASRMESSGEIDKVNISGDTCALVKDSFRCTYRGKVLAKGKGEVDMYFVDAKQ